MIKRLILLALVLLALAAPAQAQLGTVPNTFVEGVNIIDDLNENFTIAYSTALNRTGGTMTGTLTSQGIVPGTTATYDIGSTLVKFRDLFLSRNLDVAGAFALTGSLSDPDSAVSITDQLVLTSTTVAQLQVAYDGSNRLETSVSSGGAVTFNAVGASQAFAFSDNVTVNGVLTATSLAASSFTGAVTLVSTTPTLSFQESDGSADAKNWRFIIASDGFNFQTLNDASSVANNIFTVSRTGATVTAITVSPNLVTSAQNLAALGSTSAPSYSFSGDTNTGIYSPGADQIAMIVGVTGLGFYMTASDVFLGSAAQRVSMDSNLGLKQRLFATLAVFTPANGDMIYCSDCTIASPCASGGTGAIAKRLNSIWVCN